MLEPLHQFNHTSLSSFLPTPPLPWSYSRYTLPRCFTHFSSYVPGPNPHNLGSNTLLPCSPSPCPPVLSLCWRTLTAIAGFFFFASKLPLLFGFWRSSNIEDKARCTVHQPAKASRHSSHVLRSLPSPPSAHCHENRPTKRSSDFGLIGSRTLADPSPPTRRGST